MTTLITGATGTVGRHIARRLVELGKPVRALTRDPDKAAFPPSVEAVAGDLNDMRSLDTVIAGVTAAHLICFAGESYEPLPHGAELVEALEAAGTRRVTILKGDTTTTPVEAAVARSSMEWTILAPVEFMANTLYWIHDIRNGHLIDGYLDTPSTVVHEADIGDVAAHVLAEGGHHSETLWITGPEALTGLERAEIIQRVTGKQFVVTNLTPDEVHDQWRSAGFSEDDVKYMREMRTRPPRAAQVPQDTVLRLTGHAPRPFIEWVQEHQEWTNDFSSTADNSR